MYKRLVGVTVVAMLLALTGCGVKLRSPIETPSPTPKPPDIRLESFSSSPGWSLSLGYYSDFTYTLRNEGDVGASVGIDIKGDYSGRLLSQTAQVPAHQTVQMSGRADVNQRDNQIVATVVSVQPLRQ